MQYPFEFHELLLTDHVLDALGFGEYWDDCGDFGSRKLVFSDDSYYLLYEMDERNSDDADSYGGVATYCPSYFLAKDFRRRLYFLHDLYEDIVASCPAVDVELFILTTKKPEVNMWPALESYLKYKENQPK